MVKRQLRWFNHVAIIQDMSNASYKFNFTNPSPRGRTQMYSRFNVRCTLKRYSDGIRDNNSAQLMTLEIRTADREAYTNQVYNCYARGRQVLCN